MIFLRERMKSGMQDYYDYFFFDLDGTLTDPGEGITNSVAYALSRFGINVTDRRELYRFIGPPLRVSFHEFYGFSKEQCEQATAYYREYYQVTGIFENKLYPGITELLRELKAKDRRVILATSKPEEFAVRILEHFDILSYFDEIAGATMDGSRDLKSEVIRHAIKLSGVKDLSRAVMIGDREYDILGAKQNGLASIGVLFGYGSREELNGAGADALVSEPAEILRFA